MQTSLKFLFSLFSILSIFFASIGLYSLDTLLLTISILFVVATALIALEVRDHAHDSFRR